ncbi:MAG TPA: FHA domain-containing protein [Thermoanaerobaculia bacterium]|jgi:pSer/pThr/pTyr-binding forkhead associated (FHA) protein|nr:FHA domain-containing protein [Thermoanaerobaculia bacterium]
MAKLFFVGLDGTEKSYRLQTHRPFTVGRDPGNDIILRDPKVSRHHAEIVFERGFFVLHDLASANGTYVNGKRIRVAPLTHGAKVRMGNSYGRFSEELPTEADDPQQPAKGEPFEQPMPAAGPVSAAAPAVLAPVAPLAVAAAIDDLADQPTSQHERLAMDTLPHEKVTEEDLKKKAE